MWEHWELCCPCNNPFMNICNIEQAFGDGPASKTYTYTQRKAIVNSEHQFQFQTSNISKRKTLSLTFGCPFWLSLKTFQFTVGHRRRACSHTELIMSSIITFTYYHWSQSFDIQHTWSSLQEGFVRTYLTKTSYVSFGQNWRGREKQCGIVLTVIFKVLEDPGSNPESHGDHDPGPIIEFCPQTGASLCNVSNVMVSLLGNVIM